MAASAALFKSGATGDGIGFGVTGGERRQKHDGRGEDDERMDFRLHCDCPFSVFFNPAEYRR
jgi:hypothetical protein